MSGKQGKTPSNIVTKYETFMLLTLNSLAYFSRNDAEGRSRNNAEVDIMQKQI